ncbi:hypothetical protein D3C84_1075640 [compost metagenome]
MPLHPDHFNLRLTRQGLLLVCILNLDDRQYLTRGRQFFQASGNGRDRRFVTDQQVAVEDVRYHH